MSILKLNIKWLDKTYVHNRALQISEKINGYLEVEGIELIKLQYGVEVFLTDFYKLVPVLALTILTQTLMEFLIVFIAFRWIRVKAFGVHAETSTQCLGISITFFVIGVAILKELPSGDSLLWVLGIGAAALLAIFSPNDTEHNPLIGKGLRNRLRAEALLRFFLVIVFIVFSPWNHLEIYLIYGMLIAAILTTPIAYKLLKRRMNNYETYEIDP